MRCTRLIVCALACLTIAAANCSADDADDVKVQLENVKQQAASLAEQIQLLQEKIDQKQPTLPVQTTTH